MVFSLISNMHSLQDLKIRAHHTIHDTVKIIMPEGEMHHLTSSHGQAHVSKMETDVVQQLAKKQNKTKAGG